jgi:hypothetical protein
MGDEQRIRDLTLMLLYLTSWEEKEALHGKIFRSWCSYDWDALDALKDEELIYGSRKAKSVYLTDEGVVRAKELLEAMG